MGGRAFGSRYRISTTKQQQSNKQRQTDLLRKFRSLLLVTVSGGALIATPQLARAEFTPNPTAPNYVASGAETTSQAITEDNVQVTTDDTFSITTSDGVALSITGNGAIVYNDANGSDLVTTAAQAALYVESSGDAGGTPGSVTVTTDGNISGGSNGIETKNYGSGDLTVTATGTVEGEGERGISAVNYNDGNNLSVIANEVTGGQVGIAAYNYGLGDTSVTAMGTVTGTANEGIYAENAKFTQNLSVVAVDVSGGTSGIRTQNNGSGDTTITATGNVSGGIEHGIVAGNNSSAQDLTITAEDATGKVTGISAYNAGTGDTTVTSTGTVTGNGTDENEGVGVSAYNETTAGDLTVEVAISTGAVTGIAAENQGTGNTSVTATGAVSGTADTGIKVINGETANDLTVNAAAVTGGEYGINANNNGKGNTSVTTTGPVEGTGDGSTGINVYNGANTHDLTVEVVAVIGTEVGINANNEGDGDTLITATGTVTGTNNVGIQVGNNENATDLTVQAAAVTGGNSGIVVNNNGQGNTSVTATGDVTGTNNIGIQVSNGETANDLSVDAATVTGGQTGIEAVNNGLGNTSVKSTGTVIGTNNNGISVTNGDAAIDLTVEAAIVTGSETGIVAQNNGSGNTSVTATGLVTGTNNNGIQVSNDESANDLTVQAAAVTGSGAGIDANNNGSGNTSITATGTVTATRTESIGINVSNGENAGDLTVNTVAVTGGELGIYAVNNGLGNTSITATGLVTGTNSNGIDVTNAENAVDLTVNAAAVTGGQTGINANNNGSGNTSITTTGIVSGGSTGINVDNNGTGNVTVTATGSVTGTNNVGIDVENGENAGDLTVNAADVTGGEYGINANNNGQGNTTVKSTGTVEGTGTDGTGINVYNGANTHDLTVEVVAVIGGDVGINANNEGDGNTSITATGTVTGTDNVGIQVGNAENANDLTVEVATVTGKNRGISAINNGKGDTSVTATGTVTATGEDSVGINVENGESADDLTVEAASVTGGDTGIYANNNGKGNTSVTATGSVTGTNFFGINVNNGDNTQDLIVKAATVTGAEDGINTLNNGSGDTSITVTGSATGTSYAGIYAVNSENAQSLTVEAAAATGVLYGIYAENNGKRNTSVTATGMVLGTGEGSTGINAFGGSNTHDLTVEAASVTGGDVGINANNEGDGDTSITATGTVIGTSNIGIQVGNNENANDLTVQAAVVTGGQSGIVATNNGRGDTSVTATGTVTGEDGDGIRVSNNDSAQSLTVYAANVEGSNDGIRAENNGTGNTSVTSTGTVTGEAGEGISAYNGSKAQDLTVNAVNVTGGNNGITVLNDGEGDTSVTSTGTVEGEASDGIIVMNSATAKKLSVSAVDVTGAGNGISTTNYGGGDTSITSTGTVTGNGSEADGIVAWNELAAGDMSFSVVNVTGNQRGISANNFGTGNTSVTATGTVTGQNKEGISVDNGEDTKNLTVNAVNVTGKTNGIYANNLGSGNTSITTTGTVTATDIDGIVALNGANAIDLTVNTAGVTASKIGISVDNQGSGDTSITATGTVRGTEETGIYAIAGSKAQDLTINAVSATGFYEGVYARSTGNGDTSVMVTGTATATKENGVGIKAINNANSKNLTVNVANAIGGAAGVTTYNGGTGTTAITVSGIVEGGDEGIDATSSEDQAITITVDGTVRNISQSSADRAIVNGSGAVTIINNQLLKGTVLLGASGNTINNKGTWDVGGGISDLGSGTNVLNNQFAATILAANGQGTSTTTFNGVDTMRQSGSIVLQNQMVGGNTAHVGDVAIFTNGGNGDFQANGGVIYLDTDFDGETSDVLAVDNVTRQGNATMISLNLTNGINGKQLAGDGIELIDVRGTSVNDAFVLAEPVNVGLFSYGLGQGTQDTQSWFLQTNLRPTAAAASVLSVLGSRTALSTLPSMHDRLREDNPDELLLGQRSGARLVSRDLTLPDAVPQATKGVWGRVFGENSKFQSEEGGGYDAKLWGAQAGLDFYATSNQKGDRQYAGVYIGQASASGDALGGSGLIGNMNVDATTLGAYYTFSSSRGWYVDATAQYSKLSDMKLAAGGDTVRPDGSSYAVSLEAGKVLNKLSKLRTELQAQVIYQKTNVDDVTLNDNTRLTLGGLNTATGRVGVRLSKNPQYAGRFQPWVRANLWHTLNEEATVSSMGATSGTAIGGTSGEVQVGFALTPSQSSSWSAYAAAGYTFDLSGAQYSGWKGSLGLRKGW